MAGRRAADGLDQHPVEPQVAARTELLPIPDLHPSCPMAGWAM